MNRSGEYPMLPVEIVLTPDWWHMPNVMARALATGIHRLVQGNDVAVCWSTVGWDKVTILSIQDGCNKVLSNKILKGES